jgi:hypothetical protein
MKNARTGLAAICGITLFALVSVVPALADSGRYHRQHHCIIKGTLKSTIIGTIVTVPRSSSAADEITTLATAGVAISASGLILMNATAMTATGKPRLRDRTQQFRQNAAHRITRLT